MAKEKKSRADYYESQVKPGSIVWVDDKKTKNKKAKKKQTRSKQSKKGV